MKNIFLIMILCAVVWSCSNDDNPVVSETGSGEDYEIYSTIIKSDSALGNLLIILNDTTVYGHIESIHVDNIREKSHELLNQTVNDYNSKNGSSIKLKKIPGIDNFVWRSEYTGDGRNSVNITLSRIGYGDSNTQAIVSMGELFAPLAGSGTLFYLKKENGTWIIKSKIMLWIS